VSEEDTIQRIRELRSCGLSPKEIARNLGIRTAVASNVVRKLAAERTATNPEADQIDCLLNAGWSTGLKVDGHPEWHHPHADQNNGGLVTGGLVTALVTRRRRHRRGASVCVYLLDVYCLGVKNAMGPHTNDGLELRRLTDRVFSCYHAPPVAAPIELARDLVFGAADYARRLGFAPHPDFQRARAHLGPWTGPSAISFGHDGKPTYISGPYDDSEHIMRTLHRAVGREGFSHTVGVDVDQLPLTG